MRSTPSATRVTGGNGIADTKMTHCNFDLLGHIPLTLSAELHMLRWIRHGSLRAPLTDPEFQLR